MNLYGRIAVKRVTPKMGRIAVRAAVLPILILVFYQRFRISRYLIYRSASIKKQGRAIAVDTFDERFIGEYSKKVSAFSYLKTGNTCDAEDLSQEIMLSLFTSIPKYSAIENMDGFVYTICCHCWSNYYRGNKKHWKNANIDDAGFSDLSDGNDVQSEVEKAILIGKMRTEIAYLSKLRRDIVTMFYFGGKSSGEISDELNISDSTVRWHLAEIRKKLKGRIEVNDENLNYKPVTLRAFWSGQSCKTMRGIGQYRLVDNILYACYGKPLSVEEIARKLSVAAAFIEPHVEELVFMDDMKVVDGNKYQTNVFIRTQKSLEIEYRYHFDNVRGKAEKIFDVLERRFADIKAINFIGSENDELADGGSVTNKNFLLWNVLFLLINRLEAKSKNIIKQKKEYFCCIPKRKDGSEHWMRIFLREDNYTSSQPDEVLKFMKKINDWRFSDAWDPGKISSIQFASYITKQAGDRNILWEDQLQEIRHLADLSRGKAARDAYDETLIARYTELGYVYQRSQDGDEIRLSIPFFYKDEYEKLDKILLEIEDELGVDFFVDYIEGYIKNVKSQIPEFLSDNEKNYIATDLTCLAAIPYYLADTGKLHYPTENEAKRLGIIIWEI